MARLDPETVDALEEFARDARALADRIEAGAVDPAQVEQELREVLARGLRLMADAMGQTAGAFGFRAARRARSGKRYPHGRRDELRALLAKCMRLAVATEELLGVAPDGPAESSRTDSFDRAPDMGYNPGNN